MPSRRRWRLAPDDAAAHNGLAAALAGVRDLSRATEELKAARRIEPENALFRVNQACMEQQFRGCELKP